MQIKQFRVLTVILCLCLMTACSAGGQEVSTGTPAPSPSAASSPVTVQETLTPEKQPTPSPEPLILFGTVTDPSAETLSAQEPITDLSLIVEAFEALPALKTFSAVLMLPPLKDSGAVLSYVSSWKTLCAEYPDIETNVSFLLSDGALPDSVTELCPASVPEDLEGSLPLMADIFPNLTLMDLRSAAPSRKTVETIAHSHPSCTVLWEDPIMGSSSTETISLSVGKEADLETLKEYFACLPLLTEADLMNASLSEEDADALSKAYPHLSLHRLVTLNGKQYDSYLESLDFSNASISDADAFSDALSFFPKLSRLDMHFCSLSYEQLASIRDRYPDTKVVWTVRFKKWEVRTDDVAFSTKQSGYNTNRLRASDVDCLRYCTDLIALDLGHNAITNLDFLKPLTNLQVLMLSDNRGLRDISVIGSLTKLKYLELFMIQITDISVLANLPDLLDINLCVTHVEDLSPLLSCKKLERIWIGKQTQTYLKNESLQQVLEAFPNAQYDITSSSSTSNGWRDHPRFKAYQEMFKTNKPVAPFLPEQ